jgi:hypothetical protein
MSYWRGSGVDSQFYSWELFCYECDAYYLAEFDSEWSSVVIEWICEEPVKRPWWAFWKEKECGFSNSQELDL